MCIRDRYDIEGYRDEEFDKDDKGIWTLYSEMAIQRKGEDLEARGMTLDIDRNTRTSKGEYIISKVTYDKKGRPQHHDKKYPVKMKDNKIVPIEEITDDKLKNEIENFKFFSQYANFKDLKNYEDENISYNPNVPSYSVQYDLENDDYNVKQLRKRYNIPTKQAPKLLLKGTGDLKGSSVGYKDLEITFVEKKGENVYFSDLMNFNPSRGE